MFVDFFALASHKVGCILARGRSVIRIVRVADRELIRVPGLENRIHCMFALDRDGQILMRCDRTSTTFFRFQVAIRTASCPIPLGERHEVAPATDIDLSLLSGFLAGGARPGFLKLAKYWG